MFAEDVDRLTDSKTRAFTELSAALRADGTEFDDAMRTLFREMNTGVDRIHKCNGLQPAGQNTA